MRKLVSLTDLLDAKEVAAVLGLSHRNSVTTYTRKYADFPAPVFAKGRCRLWARQDIVGWRRSRAGRSRSDASEARG